MSKYRYEDDYITIYWQVWDTEFYFDLINKSEYTIKLHWDDMAFVDLEGNARRVMHSGVNYVDRNTFQPASVVPKESSLSDILLPTDNVFLKDNTLSTKGLFPKYRSQKEADKSIFLGKTVRIVFPIFIQDVLNEYIFEFCIDSINVEIKY